MKSSHLRLALLLGLATFALWLSAPDLASAPPPAVQWIWFDEGDPVSNAPAETRYFRKTFELAKAPEEARLVITADNSFTAWLNGTKIGEGSSWQNVSSFDVAKHLRAGKNLLAVEAHNDGGPAGLMARLRHGPKGKEKIDLVTDGSWKANKEGPKDWAVLDFDDKGWTKPRVLGPVGQAGPWGDVLTGSTPGVKPSKERFKVPEGFRVVEAVKIPDTDPRFSLVNMCFDAKGRLLVSREGGPILICAKPDKDGVLQEVRPYCAQVKNCHGMVWVKDALFLVGDGPKGTGVYRCRDTKGEDRIDEVTQIFKCNGGMGEHGPHGLVHGPDDCLYLCIGNHAFAKPEKLADNSPLRRWPTGAMGPDQGKPGTTEDVLLPRLNDARGHAANILAPGGTIWRIDQEGKNASCVAAGFRNHFDAAFSPSGELFTFDSDMEWDEGLPWYRAVRVEHCPPGADYLWRTGAANTPNYYIDSLPPMHETGRGSPVGVEFYDSNMFPEQYWGALFLADWSLGRIYACHLKRNGATYKADVEQFCTGNPLNVTDIAVGPDGALWFTMGGRGTQGAVYRIEWTQATPWKLKRPKQPLSAYDRAYLQKCADAEVKRLGKDKEHAESTKFLKSLLKDPDLWQVFTDVVPVAHNQGREIDPIVVAGMAAHKHPEVRATALWYAGVKGSKADFLVKALKDDDALVRRRACEALIRAGVEPPVDSIWPLLGDQDQFVCTAARLVLQRIDVEKWAGRIGKEKDDHTACEVIVALCKENKAEPYADMIFSRLATTRQTDNGQATLDVLRTLQLALVHTTKRPVKEKAFTARSMLVGCAAEFPHKDKMVNRELAIIIAHGRAAGLIDLPVHDKLLKALLDAKEDRQQQIHYFYCMRVLAKDAWTAEQKDALLGWFEDTKAWTGGHSFTPFLENILRDLNGIFTAEDRARVLAKSEWAGLALARIAPPDQAPAPALLADLYTRVAANPKAARGNEMKEMIVEGLGKNPKPEAEAALRRIADKDDSRIAAIGQVLLRSPTVENWPYLVKGVDKANPPTLGNLIDGLKKSAVKPKADDPLPFRAVITASARLNEKDRWKAVELLRHWTNNKEFGADKGEWKPELTAWTKWFGQSFPKEPALGSVFADSGDEGKYKFKDLLAFLESADGKKGDVTRGRAVFEKAQCLKCHKFGKEGEGIGPDLSAVSKRFKRADMLESVIFPSKVISDQYRSSLFIMKDGRNYTGLAAVQGNAITVLQQDGTKVIIQKGDIEQQFASLTSVMPPKLFDTLTKEEIADLFAFLETEPK
jgi:putative heme-binding domain-containing protein